MAAKTVNKRKLAKDVVLWGYYTGVWAALGLLAILAMA